MKEAKTFTDGGSRGNPGPAAIGGIIYINDEVIEFSEYIGKATNNIAEYSALIKALNVCRENNVSKVECFLDSELVVKQLTKIYKVKDEKMITLFLEVQMLIKDFDSVSFIHVLRAKNKIADTLVNKALDNNARPY